MPSFIPRNGPGGKRVWQAHVRRRGYPAQVRTFDTKAEAEAWAATIESEIARGVFVCRAEAEGTSLSEALDRYAREVSSKKKGGGVRELYSIRWWQASRLATRSLAAVRGKDVADAVASMGTARTRARAGLQGLSPNTIRLHLALLSHLFNVARTAWGMESLSNPVDLVKGQRPRLPHGRDRRLVGDEESRLMAAAHAYGGEIADIIIMAISTAMRRGEIAAMRWDHLSREKCVLLVPITKNRTPRDVPLSPSTLAVLDALPHRPDGRVWGLRDDSISQAFTRACKAAGIEGLTFHDLRHEAASRFGEWGFSPLEVAAITGHKSMQMVARYSHFRAEDFVGRLR